MMIMELFFELSFFASNIRGKNYDVLDSFFSFQKKNWKENAHNMLSLM